ncbi:DNA primase traC [Roseomonas mucosa]|uniref:DUF927 domain-containing protein n=1 Tax=Roseomonas mucosa TaxID=207340 RepID=UPI002200248A|nr:DUF927 domain-containing protein [Roseomonas mucosa]QDJ10875.1 DNA primase traC [Roseomonas mucosa]
MDGSMPHPDMDDTENASAGDDKATRALEIARLAGLSRIDYAAERAAAASRLGVTVKALDQEVKSLRTQRFRQKQEEERERQKRTPGAIVWPPGFRMEERGLVFMSGDDDALPVTVCSPFKVLGESRMASGNGWGVYLEWRDRDGRLHQHNVPRSALTSDPGMLEATLADQGLRIGGTPEARMLLRRALTDMETSVRVTSVTRTGWHTPAGGASGYALADGSAIGGTAEPMVLMNPAEDAARRVAVSGSADGWRDGVAALAVGNPVAVFCIAAAFVGPLLGIAGEDGGGVHLFGPSKRGKTVTLRMAASVWGPPDKAGALRDWRTTANALEAACEEAADGLLTLDEIQQAEARDVVGAIYAMGNGGGKGRLRSDASARRRRTWRTFFLSNGEIDVPTLANKAGQRVPPGAEVRLPSIPLPASLWPELHGRSDFQALCAEITGMAVKHHGHAARAFIANLAKIQASEPDVLPTAIAKAREDFIRAHVPVGADPQVRDVARRMALIAAAGEIATDLGITAWPDGAATEAAAAIFALWCDRRGGKGSGEDAAHLAKVRLFLVQHGTSRLQMIYLNTDTGELEEVHDPARPVVNRAGWRRRLPDGSDLYLIHPDTWRAEVCEGLDPSEVARTLAEAGHLEKGEGKNYAKKMKIPGLGQTRVYVVNPSLMGETAKSREASA